MNQKPALKKLRKAYHNQSTRGTQGFGYIDIANGIVGDLKRAQEEKDIFAELSPNRSPEILFHHRFPTSTPNTVETAHPIPVSNPKLQYDYVVVHNGVISNDGILKTKFEKEGYVFTTELMEGYFKDGIFYYKTPKKSVFNDSEALAIDLAIAIEEGKDKTEAYGSIAFIVLQIEKETRRAKKLYFGRNDRSPLKLDMTDTYMKLSSAGGGEDVPEHKLHYFDYETGEFVLDKDFEVGFKTHNYNHVGEHYDQKSCTWVKDDPTKEKAVIDPLDDWDEYERGMGYRVPKGHHTPRLPLPPRKDDITASIYKEIDIESRYTPIPDTDTALVLNLTQGQQEFYFVEELTDAYINLIEEIEYWKDAIANARADKDKITVEEGSLTLQFLLSDEKSLKHEINKIYPQGFEITTPKQEADSTPII